MLIKAHTGTRRRGRAGAEDGHQDRRLPTAAACFFNFELPKYSSKAIAKERILFAISSDNVLFNAEETGEQQDQPPPYPGSPPSDGY